MSKNAAVSIAAVVGAFLLIIGVALLVVRPWESAGASADDVELIDESTHVLDDAGADAPQLVEFFDYNCPTCGQCRCQRQAAAEVVCAGGCYMRYLPHLLVDGLCEQCR